MAGIFKAKQQCEESIAKAVKTLFQLEVIPAVEIHFQTSRKADASCNVAFQLAGKVKKSPVEIAEKIAKKIKPKKLIASVTAVNGFVNFVFSQKYYGQTLKESGKKTFGSAEGNGKTAVVEYSSPNVGKPLHIGHCRCTVHGDAVKKILECNGWKVTGSNFLCEAGTQVAKLIVGLRHYGAKKVKDEKQLLDYYVKINAEIEKAPALEQEARSVLEKMEAGDEEINAELKKVRDLSVPAIHKIYKQLGIEFNEEIYDTAYIESGKQLVNEAIEKRIAFKDKNGEVFAELEKHGVPNLIILRSNGTTLYSTRDLGLAMSRQERYNPNLSVIVTASDQNTHFKQFMKILELLGKPIAGKMRHIGYGLVVLPEGKISSRAGRVVLLQDIINAVTLAAEKEILAREPNIDKKELKKRASAIGLAALKFTMLKLSAETTVTFDFDKMVSFEGDTAAYLQYSLVRCRSILEKAKEKDKEENREKNEKNKKGAKYELNHEEKGLLMHLSAFPLVTANAARSLSPNAICDYLLKTASSFSSFYAAHSVLDAESEAAKQTRIKIVKATANVMESGLNLLGITPLKKM